MSPEKKKAGTPSFTIDPRQFQYEVAEEIAAGAKAKKRGRAGRQETTTATPPQRTPPGAPAERPTL